MIARLAGEAAIVDGAPVQPGRRAGLEAAQGETSDVKPLGQADRGRIADPAGRPALETQMDLAAQKGARGQDHRRLPASFDHRR